MDPIVGRALGRVGAATLATTLLVATMLAALPAAVVGGSVPAAPGALVLSPAVRAELAAGTLAPIVDPGRVAPTAAVTSRAAATKVDASAGDTGGAHHTGRNHVWSAVLGLNRPVAWYPCSRSAMPGMAVYRWGCAGRNNVYLFAHAGGPFRRLHDLYVRGHLRRGMSVTYADGSGVVHRYRVVWWRVVLPTAGGFAYARQPRPSMTLQTCVGKNSEYRLMVRLVEVGG